MANVAPESEAARSGLVVVAASGEVPVAGAATVAGLVHAARATIAADGGLAHLVAAGRVPDAIVGDLDSADPDHVARAQAAGAEVHRYPADKDETDLELAMALAIAQGASDLVVVGLFGGRLDHELANIALLADRRWSDEGRVRISAHDGLRSMWVVHDEIVLSEPVGTTITLLAVHGAASGVTTSGLRWALSRDRLGAGSPRGVSNVAEASLQRVTIESGTVLVIVDRGH